MHHFDYVFRRAFKRIVNFDEGNEYHVSLLKILAYIDALLVSEKIMPSDFAVDVARKRMSTKLKTLC